MVRRGSTLVELIAAMAASAVLVLGAGVVLVDSQRGYNSMYGRVNGERRVGAMRAKAAFDRIARHASIVDGAVDEGEVILYSHSDGENPSEPDKYAKMYLSEDQLLVEYGDVSYGYGQNKMHTSTETVVLADNVSDVEFRIWGAAVQMVLIIEDENGSMTVMSTAIRHNE